MGAGQSQIDGRLQGRLYGGDWSWAGFQSAGRIWRGERKEVSRQERRVSFSVIRSWIESSKTRPHDRCKNHPIMVAGDWSWPDPSEEAVWVTGDKKHHLALPRVWPLYKYKVRILVWGLCAPTVLSQAGLLPLEHDLNDSFFFCKYLFEILLSVSFF